MIKHKWFDSIVAVFMAVAIILVGFAIAKPDILSSFTGNIQPAYVKAFDKTEIMSMDIIVDKDDWSTLLETATKEEYISCTVVINGDKIKNVGIRAKGNSSLSSVAGDDTTDRYSFKLEFDHYVKGQTWLGLDKMVVNNMQGDATYLKEYLSYDIMNFIGVNTPLYAFTDITANGENWGFYLAVESLENSFTERYYGADHGELYKPESMGNRGNGMMNDMLNQITEGANSKGTAASASSSTSASASGNQPTAVTGDTANQNAAGARSQNAGRGLMGGGGMSGNGVSLQYTDDQISSYSAIFNNSVFEADENDYKRVVTALKKLSTGENLEDTVDVKAVLRYFAAHTTVVSLDSYVSNMGHNYYLYEKDGQLSILPWDYNLSFGGFQSGNASTVVNFPIDTPVSGVSLSERPILSQLLAVPEYQTLYHQYLQQIIKGYFNSGIYEETILSLDAMIKSHVAADPSAFYTYDQYQAAIPVLTKLGLLRAESIEGQLNGAIPSTSAGQSADSSALIDASGLSTQTLGSQGGGGGGGKAQPGGDQMGGNAVGNTTGNIANTDTMRQAMEIVSQMTGGALTDEQTKALKALGFSVEEIARFVAMGSGQTANSGQQGGRTRPSGQPPGGQMGSPPSNAAKKAGIPDTGLAQGETGAGQSAPSNTKSTGSYQNNLIMVGVCTASMLAGLAFVFFFKRRRPAKR